MAMAAWGCHDRAMQILRASLATLACALLGEHFLRSGGLVVAVVLAALPLALAVPHRWAPRLVQVVLGLGAVEWLRTLLRPVDARRAIGQPALRLAVIFAAVALVTALAAALLQGWRRSPVRAARGAALSAA
jgi:hypothetical protein